MQLHIATCDLNSDRIESRQCDSLFREGAIVDSMWCPLGWRLMERIEKEVSPRGKPSGPHKAKFPRHVTYRAATSQPASDQASVSRSRSHCLCRNILFTTVRGLLHNTPHPGIETWSAQHSPDKLWMLLLTGASYFMKRTFSCSSKGDGLFILLRVQRLALRTYRRACRSGTRCSVNGPAQVSFALLAFKQSSIRTPIHSSLFFSIQSIVLAGPLLRQNTSIKLSAKCQRRFDQRSCPCASHRRSEAAPTVPSSCR